MHPGYQNPNCIGPSGPPDASDEELRAVGRDGRAVDEARVIRRQEHHAAGDFLGLRHGLRRQHHENAVDIGIVTEDDINTWGLTGVMVRGSGFAWDIRRAEPYELYDEFDRLVGVTYTNETGFYAFGDLDPTVEGQYRVEVGTGQGRATTSSSTSAGSARREGAGRRGRSTE